VHGLIRRLVTRDFASVVAAGNAGTWNLPNLQKLLAIDEQL
jgi:hypothetical protein